MIDLPCRDCESLSTADQPIQLRLCVAQGPIQALAVTAAALHLAARDPGPRNVLLIGDLVYINRVAEVRDAIIACAAPLDAIAVVDADPGRLAEQLAEAVGGPYEITEFITSRSDHPISWALVRSFPDARRVLPGDGIGWFNVFPNTGMPKFDEVVAVVPQAQGTTDPDADVITVVDRDLFVGVVAEASNAPGIRELDGELAGFVQGGVVLLVSYWTEDQTMTLRGELAYNLDLVRRHGAPGCAVLIKSHPRASTGQAALIARRLRRLGHTVLLFPSEANAYPIELFRETLRAADVVIAGISSSAVSIQYLYGIPCVIELRRSTALRWMMPWYIRRTFWAIDAQKRVHDELPTWDGRTIFQLGLPGAASLVARALGRTVRAIVAWREPDPAIERRTGPTEPLTRRQLRAAARHLGVAEADVTWLALRDLHPPTFIALAGGADRAETPVVVRVAAGLPLRVPRWSQRLVPVVFRTSTRRPDAERLEEQLDDLVGPVTRIPEPVELLRMRAIPMFAVRALRRRPLEDTVLLGYATKPLDGDVLGLLGGAGHGSDHLR